MKVEAAELLIPKSLTMCDGETSTNLWAGILRHMLLMFSEYFCQQKTSRATWNTSYKRQSLH